MMTRKGSNINRRNMRTQWRVEMNDEEQEWHKTTKKENKREEEKQQGQRQEKTD